MNPLFTPLRLGRYDLPNRIVMAPMTRSRAEFDGTPSKFAADYYSQRAAVGLIVTEGTQPSDDGQGYLATPGSYTKAHVEGWKKVADAVHAAGGHIFVQLMHVGRISHPDNTPHHRRPVAPSAIAPPGEMFTTGGMKEIPTPRALSAEEVRCTTDDFRFAAARAIEAGADGVEIHGANGYLVQQFFAPSANVRTDEYGGSIENRTRFAVEVARAVAEEIGADRVGIRLSPGSSSGGINEGPEGPELYRRLARQLDRVGLAYLHLIDPGDEALLADIRRLWSQAIILNRPGRLLAECGGDLASGAADLESYGQMVLANPDFVSRLKLDVPMNEPDRDTFFSGGVKGYIDYPAAGTGEGEECRS